MRNHQARPTSRPSTVEEQRRGVRALVDIPAVCAGPSWSDWPARICELSRSGLRLQIDRHLVSGTYIDVAFELPAPALKPVSVQVRVLRKVGDPGSPYEFACELTSGHDVSAALREMVLQASLNVAAERWARRHKD